MSDETRSINRHLQLGGLAALLLVGGLGGWAATTELSGAVIATGSVVVDSNIKKVQHLTGGIVGQILVKEGAYVRAGDVVLRLDDTVTKANLAIVVKGLDEMRARKSRLEAERDGATALEFPSSLMERSGEPDVAAAIDSERRLFKLRYDARAGQRAQLRQRIAQLAEEVKGQESLQGTKSEEIRLIQKELEGVRDLWSKTLVSLSRLTMLEREATRLMGERAQTYAATAQTRGRMAEIELQILQIDQDLSSEVAKELREVDGRIGEFIERKIAAEDQLRRIDIKAPQTGYVHQLGVHTVGGVVPPGDPLMMIVPEAEPLSIEAKLQPQDIDQIHAGQPAGMRFSAFNQRTTPEITGFVHRISADVMSDQRSGASYYVVRIGVSPAELGRLGDVRLVPGMPVEVFMKTYDRTVASYFLKPLHDQVSRAFRER